MRVLLVEDDLMIGEVIQKSLKDATCATDWVTDGATAIHAQTVQHYDLILLDLTLPRKDGLDVLRSIRISKNQVPIIIITARDALAERIRGLDYGADDYVLKPFEMSELLARMRAVLRRKGGTSTPQLSNHEITLDPGTRTVMLTSGDVVQLSSREYSLLYTLMLRPGAILSRRELEEKIYGWGEEVESNAVEYLIHVLRKKLGSNVIKNVRGIGWRVSKNG